MGLSQSLHTYQGKYSPPGGRLLLAELGYQAAGCDALRGVGADAYDMKRMLVSLRFQGNGVGRALTEALIREAKTIGYSSMRHGTSIRQVEGQHL
jgi:GNAT superfamily N-acetyltransferase